MTSILEETLIDILADIDDLRHRVSRVERRESRQRHLNAGAQRELTIAAGEITVRTTDSNIKVDTQDDDGTDDLNTINGGSEGQIIVFHSVTAARDPTFKDSADNLLLEGDFTCTSGTDTIVLIKRSTAWDELTRSNNA